MIATAYRLFENIIANSSDKDLNEAMNELNKYKEKYRRSYNGLRNISFIRDLFDILIDEHSYRNQMIEEEGVANEIVFH
jgi:hypothetical protein